MRIGVIADTHIPKRAGEIPPFVLKAFRSVDMIFHAGDIFDQGVLEELEQLAPVEAVAGNNDSPLLQERLGRVKVVLAEGFAIGLTHGDLGKGRSTQERAVNAFAPVGVDAVVFGHSHIPYSAIQNGVYLFNPGSPTDKRRQKMFSCGILTIADKISGEIVTFA